MTPDAAPQQPATPIAGDLDDIYRRIVRIHEALAEPTNAEVHTVRPWALSELMALSRDVNARRKQSGRTA